MHSFFCININCKDNTNCICCIYKQTNSFCMGVDSMPKKAFRSIVLIISCFVLVWCSMLWFDIRPVPLRIANNLSGPDTELLQRLNEIYDVNFLFDRISTKSANIYLPRYNQTDLQTADFYAALFGLEEPFSEYDDYYLYSSGEESLYIDKYASHVSLQKSILSTNTDSTERIPDDVIISKAKGYCQEKSLGVKYDNVSVNFDEDCYTVSFVGKMDGYYDYSFPFVMKFNKNGDLFKLDYYFFEYENIANVDLKTMKEAYRELPADFPEGTRIDLYTCRVVYVYDESIVQPAYLFEGEIVGGKTFQCFIKAAKYSQ